CGGERGTGRRDGRTDGGRRGLPLRTRLVEAMTGLGDRALVLVEDRKRNGQVEHQRVVAVVAEVPSRGAHRHVRDARRLLHGDRGSPLLELRTPAHYIRPLRRLHVDRIDVGGRSRRHQLTLELERGQSIAAPRGGQGRLRRSQIVLGAAQYDRALPERDARSYDLDGGGRARGDLSSHGIDAVIRELLQLGGEP